MACTFVEPPIVTKSTERGTSVVVGPASEPLGWNGESLKPVEIERLQLGGDLMIMSARGTKAQKLSEMPKARPKKEFHGNIVINKGTAIKRI